jgi:large repetitive protein
MTSLKQQHEIRQQLSVLCGEAVQRQIERGDAAPAQLRQRRRHLLKALRKRLPQAARRSPEKLLHSAVMVLALWGFAGLAMPGTAQAEATFEHVMLEGFGVDGHAAPTFADIDNDGDLDAFVGAGDGRVKFYRNTGSLTAPAFTADAANNPLAGVYLDSLNPNCRLGMACKYFAAPTFADIDNDGDLDAFASAGDGTVKFYRNTGSDSAPAFSADAANNPLAGVNAGGYAIPAFADIDGDGDLDAFVGAFNGRVKFYQNDGDDAAPNFVATGNYSSDTGGNVINPLAGVNVWHYAAPTFADIDNDGDLDAFVGAGDGTVKFYRNDDTGTGPVFAAVAAGNPLAGFGVGGNATPTFPDIDNDGDLDLFVGRLYGKLKFFENLESRPPMAVDDTATTDENTVLDSTTSLLANDTDANGDTLSAVAGTFATTQGGSIVINSDGSYSYTPPANFTGIDTVDYTVTDDSLTDVGTLTITVNAPASSGGGGGGTPGIPLLATLAALLPGVWRRRNRTALR